MTADRQTLRETVAELFRVPAADIGPNFALRHPRFRGSSGRGILAAAIRRRLGRFESAAFSAATYGELADAMFGAERPPDAAGEPGPATSAAAADVSAARSNGSGNDSTRISFDGPGAPLSVGVDIETVDGLPDVSDFWVADFYRTHFSDPEIAYCVRQDHPRMHFAARWCAKEALVKCDPGFRTVDPTHLQVAFDKDSRPVFEWIVNGRTERLPHALSLTHTPALAAAIVAVPSALLSR